MKKKKKKIKFSYIYNMDKLIGYAPLTEKEKELQRQSAENMKEFWRKTRLQDIERKNINQAIKRGLLELKEKNPYAYWRDQMDLFITSPNNQNEYIQYNFYEQEPIDELGDIIKGFNKVLSKENVDELKKLYKETIKVWNKIKKSRELAAEKDRLEREANEKRAKYIAGLKSIYSLSESDYNYLIDKLSNEVMEDIGLYDGMKLYNQFYKKEEKVKFRGSSGILDLLDRKYYSEYRKPAFDLKENDTLFFVYKDFKERSKKKSLFNRRTTEYKKLKDEGKFILSKIKLLTAYIDYYDDIDYLKRLSSGIVSSLLESNDQENKKKIDEVIKLYRAKVEKEPEVPSKPIEPSEPILVKEVKIPEPKNVMLKLPDEVVGNIYLSQQELP